MKTTRQGYLSAALIAIVFVMNSCSTSQQFAGHYPENRITGKGIGQAVNQPKKVTEPTAVASTENIVTADMVDPAASIADPIMTKTVQKKQKGERIMTWANKAAEKNMQRLIAANNGTTHSLFGLREKTAKKFFAKIESKYGMDATQLTSAASIQSASKVLAIVSMVLGFAAFAWYGAFFFGPAAIATGAVALIGINRGGSGKRWMAICGIVCGAVAILLWGLLVGAILFV